MYSRLRACPGGGRALSHKCLSRMEKRFNFLFCALPAGRLGSSVAGSVLSATARSALSEIQAEQSEVS